MENSSPTDKSPTQPPISINMNFQTALGKLVEGQKIRRAEWEDKRIFLVLHDEKLMIFEPEDNQLHPLIISLGDILGDDWIIFS